MQYLLALTETYFVLHRLFSFSFSLLSTKVGVHVTGVVLRGRSLKMVKSPRQRHSSQAELPSLGEFYFLPSCFDNQPDGRNTTFGSLLPKVLLCLFLRSQAGLKQVQLLLHRAENSLSKTFLMTSDI